MGAACTGCVHAWVLNVAFLECTATNVCTPLQPDLPLLLLLLLLLPALLLGQDMWSKLVAAGLSTSTPTIFLLEGFIGEKTW
jgi:hypothetical protein